jgi:hypothetical protein
MTEDKPRKVYWAGRQWCVTDFGLETVDPDEYYVEKNELGGFTDGEPEGRIILERVRHIAEKTWVDIEDLLAAFSVAAHVHNVDVPPGAMLTTFDEVRSQRYASEAFEASGEAGDGIVSGGAAYERMTVANDALEQRRKDGWSFSQVPDPQAAAEQQ